MRNHIFNKRLSDFRYDEIIISIIVVLLLMNSLLVPVFKSDSFSTVVCGGMLLSGILTLVVRNCYECNRNVSKALYILFFIIGASFLINGICYKILGYLAIGSTFFILVPMMSYYFSSGNAKKIYKAIADGVIISFVIVLVVSIFFGQRINSKQYVAIFSNPNILGNFNIIVNAAALYRLLNIYDKKRSILYLVIASLNISICIFSNSRTSMIAIILQLLIYAFLVVKCKYESMKLIDCIKKLMTVIIVGLICFVSLFYMLQIEFNWIKENNFFQDKVTFEERMEISSSRFLKGINDKSGNDVFTSGRQAIWNIYIDDIEMKGHAVESKDIVNGERVYKNTNAHNVYLQVAYSAGLIPGLAYFIIALMVFVKSVILFFRFLKTHRMDNEIVYAIFSATGFGIVSITSAGYMMFTYLPVTLFMMSVSLLFIVDKKEV